MILGIRDSLEEEKFTCYEKVYSEDFHFILIFLCVSKFCLQQPVTKISPILPVLLFFANLSKNVAAEILQRRRSSGGIHQVSYISTQTG